MVYTGFPHTQLNRADKAGKNEDAFIVKPGESVVLADIEGYLSSYLLGIRPEHALPIQRFPYADPV
jgi:hypothetical protein